MDPGDSGFWRNLWLFIIAIGMISVVGELRNLVGELKAQNERAAHAASVGAKEKP